MNLVDINTLFGTDDKCRELLVRLRWPNGPECLRCKGPVVKLDTDKQLFYCKDCDYQFSVTSGTVFNDSHLPLGKVVSDYAPSLRSKEGYVRLPDSSAQSE